jgi:hypothetical protein
MSVVTIESKKFPDGFPEGTTLLVEWVSGQKPPSRLSGVPTVYTERRRVWKGKVTGPYTRNFDDGKYTWKAYKHDPAGISGFKDWGTFLVGMNEEQWKKISHMQPKNQRAILTTDGVAYHCNFPGCEKLSTGKIAGLLHETYEHYGVDLLASPNPEADKQKVDEKIGQTVQKESGSRVKLRPQ